MYFTFVIQFIHWKAPDEDVLNKCMYVFGNDYSYFQQLLHADDKCT